VRPLGQGWEMAESGKSTKRQALRSEYV